MKNNVLYFIIGVLATISIAATTGTIQLVETRPALPKQVLVETVRSRMYAEDDVKAKIVERTKVGWILKSVALTEDETYSKAVIVFEKY